MPHIPQTCPWSPLKAQGGARASLRPHFPFSSDIIALLDLPHHISFFFLKVFSLKPLAFTDALSFFHQAIKLTVNNLVSPFLNLLDPFSLPLPHTLYHSFPKILFLNSVLLLYIYTYDYTFFPYSLWPFSNLFTFSKTSFQPAINYSTHSVMQPQHHPPAHLIFSRSLNIKHKNLNQRQWLSVPTAHFYSVRRRVGA